MGEWECYCAFCAGPLGNFVRFGSTKPKLLAKRRKRMEKMRREAAGEDTNGLDGDDNDLAMTMEHDGTDEEEDSEDRPSHTLDPYGEIEDMDIEREQIEEEQADEEQAEDEQAEDEQAEEEQENHDGQSDSDASADDASAWSSDGELDIQRLTYNMIIDRNDSMCSYYEAHSFDPTVLDLEATKWLSRARCLGFNTKAKGVNRAFVSARGVYVGFGAFRTDAQGSDPNAPEFEEEWDCFESYNPDKQPCFPFHEQCYKLFARCLFGTPDFTKIDKDVLYSAMTEAAQGGYRNLNLDHGNITGPEQFWESNAGEEYSAADPRGKSEIGETLQGMLPSQLLTTPIYPDLSLKVKNDPFDKLPYDILYMIFPFLGTQDILSLMKASWCANINTRSNNSWKQIIQAKIFPWFWEAKALCDNYAVLDTLNYKRAFVWLDHITTPRIGMEGPLIGVANRRRIWYVCQQLEPIYRSFLPIEETCDYDKEAQDIMLSAISLQVPLVAHPKPANLGKPVSTQWIRSWDEIDSQPCTFETYWDYAAHNQKGSGVSKASTLLGMGVKFGTDERRFNYPTKPQTTWVCKTANIQRHEWIQEIILHIRDINMLAVKGDRSHSSTLELAPGQSASIEAVTIVLNSGVEHTLSAASSLLPSLNQRVLTASEGGSIVGIVGQVTKNLTIARIGILECARPGWEPADDPELSPTQCMLWAEQAAKIPTTLSNSPATVPIWRHPALSISLSQSASTMGYSDASTEMLANQVLLWAPTPSAYRHLTAISAFCVTTGIGSYDHFGQGPRFSAPIPDIIGFRAEFLMANTDGTEQIQYAEIGTGGPVPSNSNLQWLDGNAQEIPYINPNPNPQPWDASQTHRFEIDGKGGEIVTAVHVAEEGKAIKLQTNKDRECYWGEQERGTWSTMSAGDGQVIVGIVVCFGLLGGWSWKFKSHSHMKVMSVAAVTMPFDS